MISVKQCLRPWERPYSGAQLRFAGADGFDPPRSTPSTTGIPIAALELRYRLRARAEDRIRAARATGLRNLLLHDTTQNQIWLEIVQTAFDLPAWMPMIAPTGKPAAGNPAVSGSASSP